MLILAKGRAELFSFDSTGTPFCLNKSSSRCPGKHFRPRKIFLSVVNGELNI